MKFSTIGAAFNSESKKGIKYISMKIDKQALGRIYQEDFGAKICLFPKKSKKGLNYYQVVAPMPDDYESPQKSTSPDTPKSYC